MKKATGIRICLSYLKRYSFGRIYMNIDTFKCFAVEYTDCNSYTQFDSDKIVEVYKYNSRDATLSMQHLKEEINNRIEEYKNFGLIK